MISADSNVISEPDIDIVEVPHIGGQLDISTGDVAGQVVRLCSRALESWKNVSVDDTSV
jgi:hypothetical protein